MDSQDLISSENQQLAACKLCFPEGNQNMQNLMILAELIDSLRAQIQGERGLQSGKVDHSSFLELIKCVFHQKEGLQMEDVECQHFELRNMFCRKLGIERQLLFQVCASKNLKLAKRLYQLELIKTLSKNTIKTILKERVRNPSQTIRKSAEKLLLEHSQRPNSLRKTSAEPIMKMEFSEFDQAQQKEHCSVNGQANFPFNLRQNSYYYSPQCHYFYQTNGQNFY